MFSRPLLRYDLRDGTLEPAYLDERYAGLARAIAVHYEAFAGKPYRDLERAIAGAPEIAGHEPKVVAGLRRVIEEPMVLESCAPADPRQVRPAVFEAAAESAGEDPDSAYRSAERALGLPGGALAPRHLYADLGPERIVRFRGPVPPPAAIIPRYNFRLLQGLFAYAVKVRVTADSGARAIYRAAKLHGLIVEVVGGGAADRLVLEITGPLSLFRLTRKYGRSLAEFVPACAAAGRFRIEAKVVLRGIGADLTATAADPVLSSHRPPRPFDSKLEEMLERDFLALGSRWSIGREEAIVPLGSTVFIPDFTFRRKDDRAVRVDLEVVGFWTRDYLARKRSLIARLPRRKVVFCIDERLSCGGDDCPFPCIPFRRRVPAAKVLAALEAMAGDRP